MVEHKKPQGQTLPLGSVADEPPKTIRTLHPPSHRWELEADADGETTARMTVPVVPPTRSKAKGSSPPRSTRGRVEGIEFVVVEESQLPRGDRRPWRAAEVWTKRRVYGLDSTFKCVEVLDRQTGKPETHHEMLGARLGGGRFREKDAVRFSYPLPLPGMEAMFAKNKKHGYTSAVERMVVRVRVLTTLPDEMPTWEEIASRWSEPPRG